MNNTELNGKRLLIMGGMRISCEIIKKAQSMGIVVGVADYNSVENSPGKQIADEHYEVSVTDVDAMVELIKDKQFDGLFVGFNDMLLPYYADICAKSNLPCYGTKQQFETLTNKEKYKNLCRQFGIPTIKEYSISDTNIEYPVLVKPIDNSGSRGIIICKNKNELISAYNTAKSHSKLGKVIIEKYMTGPEVTVFWIFKNGTYHISAMGNRHMRNIEDGKLPQPVGYTFPSKFLTKYKDLVEPKCENMFKHLNIQNGMMFMQCKVENNICYVYDLGFRLTGSLEYKIIERVCGYNPLEMLIRYALTGCMGEDSLETKVNPLFDKYAFNISCLSAPGTIKEIVGIDDALTNNDVIDIVPAHIPGETITQEMQGLLSQITVRILGTVKEKASLISTMEEIQNKINILSTSDKNLILKGGISDDITDFLI